MIFYLRTVVNTTPTTALIALVVLAAASSALPPAPPHTVFGDVRDEFGNLWPAGAGKVVFAKASQVLAEGAVLPPGTDRNYSVALALDLRLTGTTSYFSTAVATGDILTVRVEVAGVDYLPLEVAVSGPAVGAPAQSTRLDLTLGEDTDRDGLPDAWEINELYYGGASPGPNGWDLSLLRPDGDYDKDGLSDRLEYLAGTYATDAQSVYDLRIAALGETEVEFRLHTIFGKTYLLQSSPDLATWTTIDFRLATESAYAPSQAGASTGEAAAFTPRVAGADQTFYRLIVR